MIFLDQFVSANNLQPADAIVVKKEPLRLLDHYIIYLGKHYGEHLFIANYTRGTRILTQNELDKFSYEFTPKQIIRFTGNEIQRNSAVQRALSHRDQSSYHLILNNCQHFSTYVQTGKSSSSQTQAFGKSLIATGLITAAATKKPVAQGMGLFAAALGIITLLLEEE